MRQDAVPPEAVGVAVLTLHNIAVHRVLPAPADAALNLATAVGLTAFAGRIGCSRADLGIRAEDLSSGLRTGLCAAAVATGGVAVGAALPATRGFFDDRRLSDVGHAEAVCHVALRIPLATALAEELLFRGALLALLRRRRPPAAAVRSGPRCCSEPGTCSPPSTTARATLRAPWWPTSAEGGGWRC
jgi:membrane protease YdiL (CAAX protease family)